MQKGWNLWVGACLKISTFLHDGRQDPCQYMDLIGGGPRMGQGSVLMTPEKLYKMKWLEMRQTQTKIRFAMSCCKPIGSVQKALWFTSLKIAHCPAVLARKSPLRMP